MANLSNINNKFLVTTGGEVLIGQTAVVGSSLLQVTGNATFAGNVAIQSTIPKLSFTDLQQDDWDIINDNGEFKFLCSTGSGVALQLNTNNNATFAGNVNISSPGDLYINSGTSYNNVGSVFLSNQRTEINSIIVDATAQGDTALNFKTRSAGSTASAMFIDEFRRVGIGTVSPDYKLEVESTSDADLVSIKSTAIANNTQMRLGISGNDSVISGTGGSTGNLVFKTYGSERMRIDSSGAITTDVTGEVTIPFYIDGYRTGVQQIWLNNSRAANSSNGRGTKLILGAGNTIGAYFTHYTSGSTGNGVLDIGVQYTGVTTQSGLEFNTNSNRTVLKSVGNSGYTSFESSGGTERMRITSEGKVIVYQDGNVSGFYLNGANTRLYANGGGGTDYRGIECNSSGMWSWGETGTSNYFANKVGIGTTNPSSELEVNGRVIAGKLEVARYSDSNVPAPVYVGRLANPMGAGGVFRLAAIESSSTVNKIDEPFLITYSSGHWGCQPMFFAEFTVTYYRGSYIKYWAQHEVSGSRLDIMDGPYGGQIITGGAPVSRTITQLCTNCHGGQPVYKCVWKWSNSGTYIKTSPIVSLVDGHGSARVYTSGSSSESAIDTLLGSAGSPGPAYLLMGINNAQAAGFTGLQTQN